MMRTKRIYEEPSGDDGIRILVDRLWPRGISKEEGETRPVGEGPCAGRRTAAVVRAWPGEVGGVSPTLPGRTRGEGGGARPAPAGGEWRGRHAPLRRPGRGAQQRCGAEAVYRRGI